MTDAVDGHRKRWRGLWAAGLLIGIVACVSARLWWVALHDPFTSDDVCRRLLTGATRQEAEQIFGRPADRYSTAEEMKVGRSPEVLARFGCPAGGCGDWVRAPVGIRLDFDAAGNVEGIHYLVLPSENEPIIDRVPRWFGL